MSTHDSIVILGAGITGLDVALVLEERGYGKSITVIAEHLPGDAALSCTCPCYLWYRCPRFVHTSIMRHGKDYETYVIPRPFSKGHVIVGGYMQKGNGDGATYSYEQSPSWSAPRLAAFSGLRPSREGGARVEREDLTVAGHNRTVVHNYGAGGTGFQTGYGMALDAVRTAEPVFSKIHTELKSKL